MIASTASARIESRVWPAAAQLPGPEPENGTELQLARDLGQSFTLDQMRTHPAQLAFVGVADALIQTVSHLESEDGIAQKFKPFVVAGAYAAMRQRTLQ